MLSEPMNAAADAAPATSRRPTIVPPPAAVSAEQSDRPVRRKFSAKDKLRILGETDRVTESGGIGVILRREGIYSSMLTEWRKLRDAGAIGALVAVKRGPKVAAPNPLAAELASLKRENARLTRRLACAETVIDIQKKVAALMAMPPTQAENGL
jgi:transposase-like protein